MKKIQTLTSAHHSLCSMQKEYFKEEPAINTHMNGTGVQVYRTFSVYFFKYV